MRTFLFVLGTRPEAIKLAPVIKLFERESGGLINVCTTGQHREMLDQVLSFFEIDADIDLNLMEPDQTLFSLTANAMLKMETVLNEVTPDFIIVQGDTTTAFCAALAGYYKKMKIVHIEAGLRTHDKYSPFPEEINRTFISHLADFHFAPTEAARRNLLNGGVDKNIFVVGNTVIDALLLALNKVMKKEMEQQILKYFGKIIPNFEKLLQPEEGTFSQLRKIILVTGHRRESFGATFRNICEAIKQLAVNNPHIHFVYPVHLNPNVLIPAREILNSTPNIHLIEPLSYPNLVWLMEKSYLVLTDSGGIQEEAPTLHKPVLVMREVTERWEGISTGAAKLVGTDKSRIVDETTKLLNSGDEYLNMANSVNPYGDGKASEKILNCLMQAV